MRTQRRTYFAILMTLWATTALGMQYPNSTDNDLTDNDSNTINQNKLSLFEEFIFEDFDFGKFNSGDFHPEEFNFEEFNSEDFPPEDLNFIDPIINPVKIDNLLKIEEGKFDKQWRHIIEKKPIDKNIWFMIFNYLFPKDISNFAMSCKYGLFLKRNHRSLQINTDYSPFKTPKIAIEQLREFYPNLKELIIINPTPKYLQEIGKKQKNKKEKETKLEHISLTFLARDKDNTFLKEIESALKKLDKLPRTLKSLTIGLPKYKHLKLISIKKEHLEKLPKDLENLHVINSETLGKGAVKEISSRFKKLKHLSLAAERIFHATMGRNLSKSTFQSIERLNFLDYYFSDAGLKMINQNNFPKLKEIVFSSSFLDYRAHVKQVDQKKVTSDGLIVLWCSNPFLKKLTIVNHGYEVYGSKMAPITPINTLKNIEKKAKEHGVTFNLSCFPNQIKLCESCLDYYNPKPNVTNEKRKTLPSASKNKKTNKRKKK